MRNLGYNEPQARMTRASLWQAQQDSAALHSMLQDTDTLPSWVNSKIAVASADIAKVKRYMDYKLMRRAQVRKNPSDEAQIAKAIQRLSPRLNREIKSRNKVVASAALQLRALLHQQPLAAMAFIDNMLNNLAITSPAAMKPGHHAMTLKVYTRMKKMWSNALKNGNR